MPIVKVPAAGGIGVNKDISAISLPANAWTDANNIRFLDGYAMQSYGYGEIYASPSVVPYHVRMCLSGSTRYVLLAGTGKIYAVNAGAYTDLTRSSGGDYAGAANTWTSCSLSGIPIFNDGSASNYPQSWDTNIANKFQNLANWTANTYCKSLRTYKNSLVALNITKTTTNYPFMVKWSHPADPGSVPGSWDITDASKDAGEFDLADGGDIIVDGLALRESFMIYKTNSTWRMDYTGGPYVYKFTKVGGMSGLLAKNCIAEMDGWHFVVTGSDVIMHDGQSVQSVLDKATRRFFFADLDATYYAQTFVFKNDFMNEVCIAYPSIGNTSCNKMLVFNYRDKTVSFRDIPSLNHADSGLVESSAQSTWNADTAPWASDVSTWNKPDFTPDSVRTILASANQKLYILDSSAMADTAAMSSYLERTGLHFDAPESIKLIKGIRPRISGTTGDTVLVSIGSSSDPYGTPTYTTMTHTIGSTLADDCLVSGRYIAVKFATGSAYQWKLDDYALDVEMTGAW